MGEFSRCSGGISTQAQWKNTGTEQGHQGNRNKGREIRTRSKIEEHFREQREQQRKKIFEPGIGNEYIVLYPAFAVAFL